MALIRNGNHIALTFNADGSVTLTHEEVEDLVASLTAPMDILFSMPTSTEDFFEDDMSRYHHIGMWQEVLAGGEHDVEEEVRWTDEYDEASEEEREEWIEDLVQARLLLGSPSEEDD